MARISIGDLEEGTSRDLRGSSGSGGGSGGGYYALVLGSYTMASGVSIQLDGGGGSASPGVDTTNGGNGRMIVCVTGTASVPPAQVTNGVVNFYRVYPNAQRAAGNLL